MGQPRTLQGFVRRLAGEPVAAETTTNFYAHDRSRGNAARRHNLLGYLRQMRSEQAAAEQPLMLLVGEAPGYRGCRVSGVPFVSVDVLATHPFFMRGAYRPIPGQQPQREASSTIVHAALDTLPLRPLLWNAFPLHPHLNNQPNTNRKPTTAELDVGAQYLSLLFNLFEIGEVGAVGRSAEKALTRLDIAHRPIRHPSYGGKQQFLNGLQQMTTAAGL